ncbi:hypothetical protein [Bradyrhizobium neotropicale]|uniref:hypothetical protein n=1 Tax=Bradyrhizobium neotropicale TaxID=1497615 RepID=UPI001AD61D10|nr:hypothetical protein [Bradyrhizobium neotropicale]MBO4228166.1 hypothetical protein [Bradyrhizobium neotropicale]
MSRRPRHDVRAVDLAAAFQPTIPGPLKQGDRVVVRLHRRRFHPEAGLISYVYFTGTIVGESRDAHAWQIIKDGTKWPRGFIRAFVRRSSTSQTIFVI